MRNLYVYGLAARSCRDRAFGFAHVKSEKRERELKFFDLVKGFQTSAASNVVVTRVFEAQDMTMERAVFPRRPAGSLCQGGGGWIGPVPLHRHRQKHTGP